MIPRENWVEVEGRIEAIEDSLAADHLAITVVIDAIEPVDGYPNLLHKEPGDDLTVHVRRSLVPDEALEEDAVLSARVRRADLARVYAHPDRVEITPLSER